MNMNIYLNDDVFHKLDRYLKTNKVSRSQLISQALEAYLSKEQLDEWPIGLFEFKEEEKNQYPNIEELRRDLLPPREYNLS